jgi:hypothetical protein
MDPTKRKAKRKRETKLPVYPTSAMLAMYICRLQSEGKKKSGNRVNGEKDKIRKVND